MTAIAAKTMWAHRRRLVGTAVAVILGVAFLSGTLILGDTLSHNFDRLFTQADAGTDVVVRSTTTLASGQETTRAGLDPSVVTTVQGVSGVADAVPYIEGYGKLVGKDGKGIGGVGPPTRAANWVSVPSLNPYKIAEGRPPRATNEVVVNRGAAKTGHLRLGDTTTLLTPKPLRVRIVGIATFGTADGLGPTTFTGMTTSAAERYLTTDGKVSQVMVKAAPGIDPSTLAKRIDRAVPGRVEAVTGTQVADEQYSNLNSGFLGVVRNGLLIFAIIALAVAAFSIQNTFSIVAAQRGREVGLLRALGATRHQVIASTVGEALAIGVVGSAVGWFAGVGVAGLLKGVFDGFGFALPAGGLAVKASSTTLAVATGIAATVLASLVPAVRASRVPPVAALRDLAVERADLSRRRVVAGSVVTGLGVAALVSTGLGSGGMALAGLGALVTVAGMVLVGPALARAGTAVAGPLVGALRGVTGRLARQNAARNPRRTAATAAALMIGVTVVSLFTVFGASLQASATHAVDRSLRADLVVDTPGYGGQSGNAGLSPDVVQRIASTPGVASATPLTNSRARIAGDAHQVTVVDPAGIGRAVELGVTDGSVSRLGNQDLAVSRSAADSHHWRVGSDVAITYPDGTNGQLRIGAIYGRTDLTSDYLVPRAGFEPHAGQQLVSQVFADVRAGADTATVEKAVKASVRPFGQPRVQDRAEYRASMAKGVSTVLGLIYVMLALAIVIALLGIANTLSLSIHERTRELGLLRAVGQTRRQVRAMVRWESVMVSTLGTVSGVVTGTFAGWALVRAAGSADLTTVSLPTTQLVVFLLVGAVAGVLAGIRPARRAARLDVLTAIAHE